MIAQLLSGVAAVAAIAALFVALWILARLESSALAGLAAKLGDLKENDTRLERAMREEAGRGREEIGAAGKSLREELANQLRGFQDSVLKTMAEMQSLQKTQLELFAGQLNEGVAAMDRRLSELKKDAGESDRALREEVRGSLKQLGEALSRNLSERLETVSKQLGELIQKQELAQESLRKTVEQRLDVLRGENSEKLEKIRLTVDEQLQGTLEKRLGESFKLVSERLEQVHKGLGEMQSLASGVGDLKRVLTNVKTRGAWGEVQLGSLLEQILTPEQYSKNATIRPGSQERVEFAIRLPGREEGEKEVLLPIDAKFPHEDYDRLMQAAERADAEAVEAAAKQLEVRVKNCARDIRDKYINPPHTTDFAIMFMPTEGLYAEVLRRPGLAEQLQRNWRVTLAGPTTLAAMLNALQMGFRTLAIQKRSSEVWRVLEAVKTEFGKYGQVLDKVQRKIHEASKTIDEVGARRRVIDRKLREIGTMPDDKAEAILGLTTAALEDLRDEEPLDA